MLNEQEIQKVNNLYTKIDLLEAENSTLRECVSNNNNTLVEILARLDTLINQTSSTKSSPTKTTTRATKTKKTALNAKQTA